VDGYLAGRPKVYFALFGEEGIGVYREERVTRRGGWRRRRGEG
jgi:hypothetical protein